mmetsp:Transcript_3975/g.13527  ORF Transcript_3975/g.13527 Transcript_3975/m.13527 type:complete len:278 (-) Transcript_3975:139-972(-)
MVAAELGEAHAPVRGHEQAALVARDGGRDVLLEKGGAVRPEGEAQVHVRRRRAARRRAWLRRVIEVRSENDRLAEPVSVLREPPVAAAHSTRDRLACRGGLVQQLEVVDARVILERREQREGIRAHAVAPVDVQVGRRAARANDVEGRVEPDALVAVHQRPDRVGDARQVKDLPKGLPRRHVVDADPRQVGGVPLALVSRRASTHHEEVAVRRAKLRARHGLRLEILDQIALQVWPDRAVEGSTRRVQRRRRHGQPDHVRCGDAAVKMENSGRIAEC